MLWSKREEIVVSIAAKLATVYAVTPDRVKLAASGLDVNEAAADASKHIGGEIINDVSYIGGYMVFFVDGDPLDSVVRVGIVKKRGESLYALNPQDRHAQTLFGPAKEATLEDKIKAAIPAAYWYLGTEYGTTDAAVVRVIKTDVTPATEHRGAAKLGVDGKITFKLLA